MKVLPAYVSGDPERLSRFEREANAVAALSHPNILSIFDFGSQDGVVFAVMELLEGKTLREKLDAGPISQRKAVDYALQVARGLSAAHEKGVVHRDLKPENLFVTKEGHVKILDFGLAKNVGSGVEGDPISARTISDHTQPGSVMGTVGYMSPEQVRGHPADHRSDIFCLGAVLYEMLAGQRAFSGATAADRMSAILSGEPPELSASGRKISPGSRPNRPPLSREEPRGEISIRAGSRLRSRIALALRTLDFRRLRHGRRRFESSPVRRSLACRRRGRRRPARSRQRSAPGFSRGALRRRRRSRSTG